MNPRLVELIRRRERLLMRADAQRAALTEVALRWSTPFSLFDRGMTAARGIKSHPALVLAAVAALALLRPRAVAKWAGRSWVLWRFWRSSRIAHWFREYRRAAAGQHSTRCMP